MQNIQHIKFSVYISNSYIFITCILSYLFNGTAPVCLVFLLEHLWPHKANTPLIAQWDDKKENKRANDNRVVEHPLGVHPLLKDYRILFGLAFCLPIKGTAGSVKYTSDVLKFPKDCFICQKEVTLFQHLEVPSVL